MSLYNKYRPQDFESIIGQKHIVNILKNAIIQDKLVGAYLFVGPHGTGKTTTARILAKAICCYNENKNTKPCNICESCINISNGSFIDVIEIDAASHRKIEEIKELLENTRYRPTLSKKKVYIIDECHMLTKESFNALLKTLEEPPDYLHFILATTEVQKVPTTIISRCQRFDFYRIKIDDLIKKLSNILDKENIKYDIESLKIIAKYTQGGFRDAEVLLEQIITSLDNNKILTIDNIINSLNLLPINIFDDFVDTIQKNKRSEAIQQIHELYYHGINIELFYQSLISYLRDIMIDIGIKNEDNSFYIKFIKTLIDAKKNYYIDNNPIFFLEIAIIHMTKEIDENISPSKKDEIQKNITSNLSNDISINKSSLNIFDINEFKKQWVNVINDKTIPLTIKSILKTAILNDIKDTKIIFKLKSKTLFNKLTNTVLYNINNLVKKYIGIEYTIHFILEEQDSEDIKNKLYLNETELQKKHKEIESKKEKSVENIAKLLGGYVE